MIQAADIEQMSLEEQLQAMELLWASLSRRPDTVPSPDWHANVLAERMANIVFSFTDYTRRGPYRVVKVDGG